jgi:hypothetical protein
MVKAAHHRVGLHSHQHLIASHSIPGEESAEGNSAPPVTTTKSKPSKKGLKNSVSNGSLEDEDLTPTEASGPASSSTQSVSLISCLHTYYCIVRVTGMNIKIERFLVFLERWDSLLTVLWI